MKINHMTRQALELRIQDIRARFPQMSATRAQDLLADAIMTKYVWDVILEEVVFAETGIEGEYDVRP